MKRIAATLVAIAALFVLPSAAFAGSSSTCTSYNPQLCQVVSNNSDANGQSGTPSSTGTTSTGSLPFTGLDVGLLAAGGIVLLGAGLAVRRLSAGS